MAILISMMATYSLLAAREIQLACDWRGASGREFVVEFRGVQAVRSKQPEGMMIYALSEMRAPSPQRLFVFANWDEDDELFLEVEAENVSSIETHTTQQT